MTAGQDAFFYDPNLLAQEVARMQAREAYLARKVRSFCAACERQTAFWCDQSDELKAYAETLENEADRLRCLGIDHGLGAFLLPGNGVNFTPEDYHSDGNNEPTRLAAWKVSKRELEMPEHPTSAREIATRADASPSGKSDGWVYLAVSRS